MQQHMWFTVSRYTRIASKYGTVPFSHVRCEQYTTRMHDEETASFCTGISTFSSPKLSAEGILTNFDSQQRHNTFCASIEIFAAACLRIKFFWDTTLRNCVNGSRRSWGTKCPLWSPQTNYSFDIQTLKTALFRNFWHNSPTNAAPRSGKANTSTAPQRKLKNSHSVTRCYSLLIACSCRERHRDLTHVA
jgi:hypothetical protein